MLKSHYSFFDQNLICLLIGSIVLNVPALAANRNEQIGNSYFKSLITKPINQLGAAIESRENSTPFYLFFNQLTVGHVFYELRAYGVINKITSPIPLPIATTQQSSFGYGGAALLGYNINITPNVSFLPHIRGQILRDAFASYSDSLGNQMGSMDYSGSAGAKISVRITDVFALYVLGSVGYQWSALVGDGFFIYSRGAAANVYLASIDVGAPYKIQQFSLSITPFAQVAEVIVNPNRAAVLMVYPVNQSSNLNYACGIKLGYDF